MTSRAGVSTKKKRPRAEFTRDVGVETRLQCPANKKALKSSCGLRTSSSELRPLHRVRV